MTEKKRTYEPRKAMLPEEQEQIYMQLITSQNFEVSDSMRKLILEEWPERRAEDPESSMNEPPFFLILIDEDRKRFTVEGPLTDDEPWNRAVAAARSGGRNVRCCNVREKSRADTIAVWQRHYGHFYRFVESGSVLLALQ